MRLWIVALAALVIGAAGGVAAGYGFKDEIELALPTPASKAGRALRVAMVDPDSLQLRNVAAMKDGTMCGEYNARNRSGGYAGFSWFVVKSDGGVLLDPSDEPSRTISDLQTFRDALAKCVD